MLLAAVERFSTDADVKDMVCTNKVREKKGGGGGEAREAEEGRDTPQETAEGPKLIWGKLYADAAGTVSRSRNSLATMMTVFIAVCASLGLTSLESQNGNHVPDDEMYGKGNCRY